LGEECDEEGEVNKASHGRNFAAVNVDRIANALKGVKADAERKNDVDCPRGDFPAEPGDKAESVLQQKVRVFECGEKSEVRDDADQEPKAPARRPVGGVDQKSSPVVDQTRKEDDPNKPGIPGHVKEPARNQQKTIFVRARRQG